MSYGLEVTNDTGIVIIDSEHRQLCLVETRVVSFTHDSAMYVEIDEDALGSGTVTFPTSMLVHHLLNNTGYPSTELVVGFQCAYGIAFTDPWSTGIATLLLEYGAPSNTTATIYFFYPKAVANDVGYGMAVYDATGETIFNSNYKYMHLKDVVNLSIYAIDDSCGPEFININGLDMHIMGGLNELQTVYHSACSSTPILIPPRFPCIIGIEPTWFPEFISFLAIGFKNISTSSSQIVIRCGTLDGYMDVSGDPDCNLHTLSNAYFQNNTSPATAMHFQLAIVDPW